ncbi:kinase-like protein [Rhizophagus irregularis]|uniref:Kinase-like protein n=1 Tax=Rhizophagus irregularis TaxID=588596 RepID=A0A2N0Q732_9GLOM|nr:kinase-like protein [Rhizophagus irregularis]
MKIASHPSIIRFFGVTKLQNNANYSFVLEYVEDGTLEKHLRDNARALIEWKRQLKFAKEIAVAVFWLHHNKIIHGDLNPKNILMHPDFWCSCLEGEKVSTKPPVHRLLIIKQKKDENARNSYLSKTQMLSWQHESDEKPGICEVISKLNSIVPIMSEKKMKYQLILISKKAKRRTN